MLLGLMEIIWSLYVWTWFIWPFVLIFTFAHGLSKMIVNKDHSGNGLLFLASISLLIILAGIISPSFY